MSCQFFQKPSDGPLWPVSTASQELRVRRANLQYEYFSTQHNHVVCDTVKYCPRLWADHTYSNLWVSCRRPMEKYSFPEFVEVGAK